jgi:hypothetical protein
MKALVNQDDSTVKQVGDYLNGRAESLHAIVQDKIVEKLR